MAAHRFARLKNILGFSGPLILSCSVFTPAVTAPVLGDVSYFLSEKGSGGAILVLAFISLLAALTNKYRVLWYTGFGCAGIAAYTFWNLSLDVSEYAPLGTQTYRLSWGWSVMIVGIGAVIAAAALGERDAHDSLLNGNRREKPEQ